MANFCDILSELRKDSHVTHTELAKLMVVTPATVSHYETGRHAPSLETVLWLADFFGVTTDYLLGRTSDSVSAKKLEQEFASGKTVGETVDLLLSLRKENRELAEAMLQAIRVNDAVQAETGKR